MKLVLLGTTGYHPNHIRHTASFLFPKIGLLFDAGTGVFRLREYLETDELDIFLSHAHLDHVVGLTFLLGQLFDKNMQRVTIHGRLRDLDAIRTHLFCEELFPVPLPYECVPLERTVPVPGGGMLTHFPLEHPGGSVGYRIDWPDRSFAYVTDTVADVNANYVKSIRGVDVLIHECYFSDGIAEWAKKTGHSWASAVAEVAREAEVGKVVLVHQNPLIEEIDAVNSETAKAIYPNLILGEDLMEIEI